MHTTLRDLFAREQTRQTSVASLVTPEDLQQQNEEEEQKRMMMPGQGAIKPSSALPKHVVRHEPDRYPVDQAKKLHSFLKNAAGGPATGFVTEDKESHDFAHSLARSGHLQHHGTRPGAKGGGVLHHWSMTPKGLAAIGMGGTKKPGQNQPRGAKAGSGQAWKPGGG